MIVIKRPDPSSGISKVTKKYKVNLTQCAQNDLEHIYSYIAADSIISANKFLLELEEQVYSLEIFPERYSFISENEFFDTDYRHLNYKKYRIIYRISMNIVYILRIIQGTQLLNL